ncbi:HAD family hydrolase [Acetanaerobacterium sp. MSJ-12]|nr:HAD family hydrolase [Acetanaerobacterium sp. MSJ-12]
MKMDFLEDCKVVILDMDGTLYQDEGFIARNVAYLAEGTRWQGREDDITAKCFELIRGQLPLKLGHFYETDANLHCETVEELFAVTPVENRRSDGFEERFFDHNKHFTYMGDAWSVTFFIGERMGIPRTRGTECFLKVREEMLEGPFAMHLHEDIKEAVGQVTASGKKTYIFTNTQQVGAEGFIRKLGLLDKVYQVKYGTNKPYGLDTLLPQILKETGVRPEEMLSIGDHTFNDLSPIKKFGGKTICMSPYEIHDNVQWDARLTTLDQLCDTLRRLAR